MSDLKHLKVGQNIKLSIYGESITANVVSCLSSVQDQQNVKELSELDQQNDEDTKLSEEVEAKLSLETTENKELEVMVSGIL